MQEPNDFEASDQDGWSARTLISGLILVLVVIAAGALWLWQDRPDAIVATPTFTYPKGECSNRLSRAVLDEALSLSAQYLLNSQQPEGYFTYKYDWKTDVELAGDNPMRQAGAAWALALINQQTPSPEIEQAIRKALGYLELHSRRTANGARYLRYPGESRGELGTVAFLVLAHIEFLRSLPKDTSSPDFYSYSTRLEEYLRFILNARRDEDGLLHGRYELEDGKLYGDPDPRSDGRALLALTHAAIYLKRKELQDLVLQLAAAGHEKYFVAAEGDGGSRLRKRYYQWGAASYFALLNSGWSETDKYGEWLIQMADWMIDEHRTLDRQRNTAYAYKGIIPAYWVAELRGDEPHAKKFGCTIETGLDKLISWQVGSSIANDFIASHEPADPRAVGGVQDRGDEAELKLGVLQDQTQAVILARQYFFAQP